MNDFDSKTDTSKHNIYKNTGYFTSTPGFLPSLAHPTDNVYVRDSCLANANFNVDPEKPSVFQRKHYLKNNEKVANNFSTTSPGKFKPADGTDEDVIIKTILASNIDALYDFKYNAEAYSLIPDYISQIKMLDKCSIFSTNGTMQRDRLIVVVIENMKSFKQEMEDIYLKAKDNPVANVNKFSKLLDGLVKACDAFNNCGFFHKNLKYKNIGIGKKDRVVLTDFMEAGYIEDLKGSNHLDNKPPLNSFYICVYILRKLTKQDKIYPSWISHLIYTGSFYYALIKKTLKFNDDKSMIAFLQKNMIKITPDQILEFSHGVKYYFPPNDTRFDNYSSPKPLVKKIFFEKRNNIEKIDPNIDVINAYLNNKLQQIKSSNNGVGSNRTISEQPPATRKLVAKPPPEIISSDSEPIITPRKVPANAPATTPATTPRIALRKVTDTAPATTPATTPRKVTETAPAINPDEKESENELEPIIDDSETIIKHRTPKPPASAPRIKPYKQEYADSSDSENDSDSVEYSEPANTPRTVSYTHLTLPTIYSV